MADQEYDDDLRGMTKDELLEEAQAGREYARDVVDVLLEFPGERIGEMSKDEVAEGLDDIAELTEEFLPEGEFTSDPAEGDEEEAAA